MADEFLSQEEVNLLLETLGKEEKKEVSKEEEKVKPLDLNLFERISAGRMPGLELIFEKWASSLRKGLTSLVATIPDVYKENISIVRFREFISKLPLPCAIGILVIEPLVGQSLIAIDPKLIYMVVSNIFGGGAKPYKIEGKDFTRIELRLIQRLLNICYQELEHAWSPFLSAKIVPVGIETNPALLTIARAKEKFILLKLNIVIENNEGYIYLAIPETSISPYKDLLKSSAGVEFKGIKKEILKIYEGVPLKLEVVLGRSQISFQKLLELKVGDVIVLDRPLKEPLEAKVENIPKLLVFLGQVGRKKAIKIAKDSYKED